MSEYKRLTERHENGYIELMCNSCKYNDKCDVETHYCNEAVKNCLAELEDKIENGTLVALPYKCIEELNIIKDGMIFIFYKMCLEQNLGQAVFIEYKSKINEWFKNYLKNKGL